jgi:hypothetical protein
MQAVKRFFGAALVLLLSAAIYTLLVDGRGFKRSVLRPTLEALGDRLYAAVAEDSDKKILRSRYDEFMRKAVNQEIPPHQIERVAADILNLSKEDSVVSVRDALDLLLLPPPAIAAGEPPPDGSAPHAEWSITAPAADARSSGYREQVDPHAIAERLQQLQAFQDEYKELARGNHAMRKHHAFYTFNADSGLRVVMDKDLDKSIREGVLPQLDQELAKLERKRLLTWKHREPRQRLTLSFGPDSTFYIKMQKLAKMKQLQPPDSITIKISGK